MIKFRVESGDFERLKEIVADWRAAIRNMVARFVENYDVYENLNGGKKMDKSIPIQLRVDTEDFEKLKSIAREIAFNANADIDWRILIRDMISRFIDEYEMSEKNKPQPPALRSIKESDNNPQANRSESAIFAL